MHRTVAWSCAACVPRRWVDGFGALRPVGIPRRGHRNSRSTSSGGAGRRNRSATSSSVTCSRTRPLVSRPTPCASSTTAHVMSRANDSASVRETAIGKKPRSCHCASGRACARVVRSHDGQDTEPAREDAAPHLARAASSLGLFRSFPSWLGGGDGQTSPGRCCGWTADRLYRLAQHAGPSQGIARAGAGGECQGRQTGGRIMGELSAETWRALLLAAIVVGTATNSTLILWLLKRLRATTPAFIVEKVTQLNGQLAGVLLLEKQVKESAARLASHQDQLMEARRSMLEINDNIVSTLRSIDKRLTHIEYVMTKKSEGGD